MTKGKYFNTHVRMKILPQIAFIIILAFSLLASSCGNKKLKVPNEYLNQEELVSLLVDIHLVDGILNRERTTRQIKEDSAYNYYAAILKEHQISRSVFDSTIHFYSQHPDDFAELYDDVLKKLSIMEGERREIIDQEKTDDYEEE